MERDEVRQIVEAILFVSDKPVSVAMLKDAIRVVDPVMIRDIVDELNKEYVVSNRSFSIKEIAGGFQMLTDPVYSKWISAMYKKPSDRLTGPALETLAIIAYKQPLTRSEIEAIRGVNVDGVLHTLEERTLIRARGRLDAPGRPILYGTTNEFLQHFGLRSLEELPKLKEFQENDLDFIKDKERQRIVHKETGKAEETASVAPTPGPVPEKIVIESEEPQDDDVVMEGFKDDTAKTA